MADFTHILLGDDYYDDYDPIYTPEDDWLPPIDWEQLIRSDLRKAGLA